MTDMNDGVTGGWRLDVRCTICDVEGQYRGFILSQAGDAAIRDGWSIDMMNLALAPSRRDDLCPMHAEEHDRDEDGAIAAEYDVSCYTCGESRQGVSAADANAWENNHLCEPEVVRTPAKRRSKAA